MELPHDLDKLVAAKLAPKRRHPAKIFLFVLGTIALVVLLIGGGVAAYNVSYSGRVYPGVRVGAINLGGLTAEEVKNLAETTNNRYAKEGIRLDFTTKKGDPQQVVLDTVVASDNVAELIAIDSNALAALAMSVGREGSAVDTFLQPLYLRFVAPRVISAVITKQDAALTESLHTTLAPFEDMGKNATPVFAHGILLPTVAPAKEGYSFNYTEVGEAIAHAMSDLSFRPVGISLKTFVPYISTDDVTSALGKLDQVFSFGGLSVNYTNSETAVAQSWSVGVGDLTRFLVVEKDSDEQAILSLQPDLTKAFLKKTIVPEIDREPAEAKFLMEDTRVKEFQASKNGLALDVDETYNQLNLAFKERNYATHPSVLTVSAVVKIVEPTVKTADVNNLGIRSVIGVGTSTFRDSHTNRIKNIANAVTRLNGLLIKPGETFSANKAAGPFTSESGFLPEQVIKGRTIQKEIGGGMCQIGTTLFRMAMQTGLAITERHNHSLVVSYYADPVNHNPGTDATLYEPSLDLKFLNDTGNYILLQTAIDYKKQLLTFTLWGQPDGRTGAYTRPLVKKWIEPGEPEEIFVDNNNDMQDGERKCQAAFRGAVASFTYSRTTPSGEKIDQVFDSFYRPLPKICMIKLPAGSCQGKADCLPPPGFSTSTPPTPIGAAGE